MIVKAMVKVSYWDLCMDFPYYELYKDLKTLYENSNKNVFLSLHSVLMFDKNLCKREDLMLEALGLGKMIILEYDDVIQKPIEAILKYYGAV